MLRTTTILALVALMNVAALGQDLESKLSVTGARSDGRTVKLGSGGQKISLHVKASNPCLVGFIATAAEMEPVIFGFGQTDWHGRLTREFRVPEIHDSGAVRIFAVVLDLDSLELAQSNSLLLKYEGSKSEPMADRADAQQDKTYTPLTKKADVEAMNTKKQDGDERNAPRPRKADVEAMDKKQQDSSQRNAPRRSSRRTCPTSRSRTPAVRAPNLRSTNPQSCALRNPAPPRADAGFLRCPIAWSAHANSRKRCVGSWLRALAAESAGHVEERCVRRHIYVRSAARLSVRQAKRLGRPGPLASHQDPGDEPCCAPPRSSLSLL